MRTLGLLCVLLASSAAPHAQQRFIEACVDSAKDDDVQGADMRSVCGCGAERAIRQGISGASLDGLMQYVGPDGNLALDEAPEPVQALSEVVIEGLFSCLFDSVKGALPAPAADSPISLVPPARVPPVGRAAPGRASARSHQSGAGAVIRIRR